MELLQLKYFIKVAETEHMSRAAQELFISQSSLSHTIHRLELELGVQLFDRNGRNIRLNEYGRLYLEHAKQVFQSLDEGARELKRLQAGKIRPVTILTTIPDILNDLPGLFQNRDSPYPVQQRFVQRELLPQSIVSGSVDFAISEFPGSSHGLEGQKLFEDELYLVIGLNHPLASRNLVSLSEIGQEYAFAPPKGVGIRVIIDDLFEHHGMALNILSDEMTTTITSKALRHAAAGDGVIYISKYALYRYLQAETDGWMTWNQQVKVLHIDAKDCQWNVGLTHVKQRKLSTGAQILYHYVQAEFRLIVLDMEKRIGDFFAQQAEALSIR